MNMLLRNNPGDAWWIQTGYYTGTVGIPIGGCPRTYYCIRRATGYGLYFEFLLGNENQDYDVEIVPAGTPWAALTHKILRIDHYTSTANPYCFVVYRDYNVAVKTVCTNVYNGYIQTGSPGVWNEAQSVYSASIAWPAAFYGSTNPGTNNTIRVRGANGWQDWNTSLLAGKTATFFEDPNVYSPSTTTTTLTNHYWFYTTGSG
jgi:hypothetical protein